MKLKPEHRKVLAFWAPKTLAEIDRKEKEWANGKPGKLPESFMEAGLKALNEVGRKARADARLAAMPPASAKIQ